MLPRGVTKKRGVRHVLAALGGLVATATGDASGLAASARLVSPDYM